MTTISTSGRIIPGESAAGVQPVRRFSDRLLGALAAWIEMRTCRRQAWVDAAIERSTSAAVRGVPTQADWWRSWRASTRRRGCLR